MATWLLWGWLWASTAWAAALPDAMTASYTSEAKGDYDGALAALASVTAAGDSQYVVVLRRGWLHYLAGRYADAVAAYQEAVKLRPDSVEARLGLTLPLMALRRWSDAQATCEGVLKEDPGSYLAGSRLAWVLYSQGRYADAAARYEGLVKRYPSDVEMRAGLGWSWVKLGRSADARAAFAWVLQVSPTHASAKEGLSVTGG